MKTQDAQLNLTFGKPNLFKYIPNAVLYFYLTALFTCDLCGRVSRGTPGVAAGMGVPGPC